MCFNYIVLALLLSLTVEKGSWEDPGLNLGPLAPKAGITPLDHYLFDKLEQNQVQIAIPSLDY